MLAEEEAEQMRTKQKMAFKRLWKDWAKPVLVAVAIVTPLRSSIADWNDVPTGSMEPTILEGDRIFVNKLAYDLKIPFTTWHLAQWGNPERGDIVVCYSPADGKRLVKRVVAIPGDTVAMRNGRLVINGTSAQYTAFDQAFIDAVPEEQQPLHVFAEERVDGHSHPIMLTPSKRSPRFFGEVSVSEGQYVVMGDNRDNSFDSRLFGFVDRKQIVGKAPAVVVSFNRDNFYLPRRDRWFKRLP